MFLMLQVTQVKKQRVEINKILIDTRNTQKETNTITDTLNRTFAVVEEMVFKVLISTNIPRAFTHCQDAPKSKGASDIYKLLAKLNQIFTDLTEMIRKAGQVPVVHFCFVLNCRLLIRHSYWKIKPISWARGLRR